VPWRKPTKVEEEERGSFLSVIDIGSQYIKALVLELRGSEGFVIGAGKTSRQTDSSEDGGIYEATKLASSCEEALRQAEDMTEEIRGQKIVPDWAIIGIPGQWVKGIPCTIQRQRLKPQSRVSKKELARLLERAQHLALLRACREMALSEAEICLLHTDVVEVALDGNSVTDPFHFRGRHVAVTVFNAFVATIRLETLHALTSELELEPLAMLAQPYALAHSLGVSEAICLDIGGESTDIVLVSGGTVMTFSSIPWGGRHFAQYLSDSLSLPFEEAEKLKRDYYHGWVDETTKESIERTLVAGIRVWIEQLQEALKGLTGSKPFPDHFCLCGGGSLLPLLAEEMRTFPWMELLPFSRHPEVIALRPEDVPHLIDRTGTLVEGQDIPPIALACQALRPEGVSDELREMLTEISAREMNVYIRGGAP